MPHTIQTLAPPMGGEKKPSYFADYQFIWIYETYSVVNDWDGKAKQDVFADPIKNMIRFSSIKFLRRITPNRTCRSLCQAYLWPLPEELYPKPIHRMCLLLHGVVTQSTVRSVSPKSREGYKGHRYVINIASVCHHYSVFSDQSYIHHCCTYDSLVIKFAFWIAKPAVWKRMMAWKLQGGVHERWK